MGTLLVPIMPSITPKTGSAHRGVISLESPDVLEFTRHELSRRKQVVMRMSGSSMRPTIEDGELFTVVAVQPHDLRPRDVIMFSTDSGTALVHRLVRLSRRDGCALVLARGDYSQLLDPPIPLTRVIARVVAVQKRGSKRMIPLRRQGHVLWKLAQFLARLLPKRRRGVRR